MTENEFIKELRKTPRDWLLTSANSIRRTEGIGFEKWQCPISAIVGLSSMHYFTAARELRMSKGLSSRIVRAADASLSQDKKLRAKLLRACGLKSVKTKEQEKRNGT